MRYTPIYDLCSPIVKSYRKDMEHDRAAVNDTPEAEFIISARETGTHIVSMYPANHEYWPKYGEKVPYLFGTAGREYMLEDGVLGIAQYITKNPGELLIHVTRAGHKIVKASEVLGIVEDYAKKIRRTWKAEVSHV